MMKELIRQRARELGFDACRFTTAAAPQTAPHFQDWLAKKKFGEMQWLERNADKRVEPQKILAGARSVIVLATSYTSNNQKPESNKHDSGVIARYAQFADYHDILAEPLKALTQFVNELSNETRSLWYVDTGPILERDLAQRAGLGFAGKHTNLISRNLGNWFFLSEILTTLALEPDASENNHCGNCTRCISACPTNAITAPFELDARKCISYLTIELKGSIPVELRRAIGNRVYGCDDCLAACPWNRFAREGSLMKAHALGELASPNLVELLSVNDTQFKSRFAGSPILRTKRRGFLRNVCVALGNTGSQAAIPALEKASKDHEPLIVEHAQWAIEEIKARAKG